MLHLILNILSLSSHSARGIHFIRINSGNTCFAWSWVIRSWFRQLLQWKYIITHSQQTKVRNRFELFLHLLPSSPRLFSFQFPSRLLSLVWGRWVASPLQIEEKRESGYDFLLKSAHPNCLVTLTDKHGWAVTVVQVPNDHIFRVGNAHCSMASLHYLSWSRDVFQLPSCHICCFFIAVYQSQHLLCSLLLRSSAGKCYLYEI